MNEELSKRQLLDKIAELEKANEILELKLSRVIKRHKNRIDEFKSNIHLSYFNRALERLAFYMYVKDQDGKYIYSNQRLLDLFNLSPDDLYGKDDTHFHSDAAKYIQKIDQKVLKKGEGTENEVAITLPDQSVRIYKEVKTPIFDSIDDKKIIGLLGISLDITEIKESQKVLEQSEKQLRQFNEIKNKLISVLAHDLKTPFDNIQSLSNLIINNIEKGNWTEVKNWAELINNAAISGTNLLIDLFEWVQSQSDQMIFNPTKLPIIQVIEEAIEAHRISATKKGIKITNLVPHNLQVKIDRAMMAIVFRNLISNAVKFTHNGGEITISYTPGTKKVSFKIADTGIGIPEDKMKILFSSSFSTPGTEKEKGTGLGLILCKEFVEKNGGKLKVKSEVGKGSEFIIELTNHRHLNETT